MQITRSRILTSFLLLTVLGCSSQEAPEQKQVNLPDVEKPVAEAAPQEDLSLDLSKPEATFATFKTNVHEGKWKAGANCLTEDSQASLCGVMIFMSSLTAAFDPESKEGFEALMKKHGAGPDAESPFPGSAPPAAEGSPQNMMRMLGSAIKNKPAFLEDLMAWMSESGGNFDLGKVTDAKLEELKIEGDKATAFVVNNDKRNPIEFQRLNERWKIHLPDELFNMENATGDQAEMQFGEMQNFDDFDYQYVESDELPPMQAVTVEEYKNAWQVDVSVDSQPAAELITKMAAECGFELFNPEDFQDALSKPITLNLQDVSRLQAIEAACEQVGLYPRYRLKSLGFKEGPRPFPATFSGPFLLTISSLNEYPPYAAGDLKLQLIAAGIPSAAVSSLQEVTDQADSENKTNARWIINQLTGTGDLKLKIESSGYQIMMSEVSLKHAVIEDSIPLGNLVQSVQQIQSIDTQFYYSIPTEIITQTFDKLEKGETIETENFTLTLKQARINPNADANFTIEYTGLSNGQITILGLDAEGNPVESSGGGGFWSGDKGTTNAYFEKAPAKLQVQIVKEFQQFDETLSLSNIPLAEFKNMPEEIAKLSFPGEAPVSFKFLDLTEENGNMMMKYTITNHSNKDISNFSVNNDYLDADGKKLKDFPHSQSGERNLVPAGETRKFGTMAFFAPEETKSVAINPRDVNFADNTSWEFKK
ncbi:hypothetical protein [Rubinisphaera sp.]|uniref:hypothetical protein n=1 Tax=Rubinisphaera sp. TaxID=2024857 RepID=UPI000C0F3B03|nr:hypothetical protein [Rubinisphaera sp.]MBV07692.1 hypothetical protein [Rubinisphaera sp.]HCS51993.1 hypothetical protein [Planctomycetaceae bacterium]|tara:strand:+ start:6598 stop:8712 length:2115 start_codon:yes stop_codon:yes gene_type:complete